MKVLILGLCMIFSRCGQVKNLDSPLSQMQDYHLPYDLDNPTETWQLNSALQEISGITYDADKDELLAVNDEEGKLFHLSTKSGAITSQETFGGKGDYESISQDAENLYIVESNGDINIYNRSSKQVTTRKTDFSAKNDIEASEILPSGKLLMIGKGKKMEKSDDRWIYTCDLTNGNLTKLISINTSEELFPSAMAINPISDYIYILSAKTKILIVIDQDIKQVISEVRIPSSHHQAEGICFDPSGNMYVSDEGGEELGKVTKYSYLSN